MYDILKFRMGQKQTLHQIELGTGQENYFHLKRVMAKLQHMCLCECDHPLQVKIILQTNYIINCML